jgi:hypothetical protein
LPVHAVNTATRMPAATTKIDRRKRRRPPIFIVPPKGVGAGARQTPSPESEVTTYYPRVTT